MSTLSAGNASLSVSGRADGVGPSATFMGGPGRAFGTEPSQPRVSGPVVGLIGPLDVQKGVAGTCPQCGGPNAANANACQWCGADMPLPSTSYPPPLIFNHPTAPVPAEREEMGEDEEAGSDDADDSLEDQGPFWTGARVARLIVAVIALIVVVATVAYTSSNSSTISTTTPGSPGGGPVDVSVIQVNSPDNACGLAGAVAGAFSVQSYATHPISWWLPVNGASIPCRVTSVISDTPGFSLWANVPLNVTAAETPLMVSINTPATYVGVLTLTII